MANYELRPDEVILYEGTATCNSYKGSLLLTLTSQKIVFEKEKGLFKKERELIEILPLERQNQICYNTLVYAQNA